jgi:hypothetical protein
MIGTEAFSTHVKAFLTTCSWFRALAATKVIVETYWDTIIVPSRATLQFIWRSKALRAFVEFTILAFALAFLAFTFAFIRHRLVGIPCVIIGKRTCFLIAI